MSSAPKQRYELWGLARLFSAVAGDERAHEAVRDAAVQLGLRLDQTWSREQALDVLERIAETPGVIGVAARFAKSRIHLAAR